MGPLCSPNRARRAGHLPPLPLDKPPSRDHPCSFPIASLVYGTYQGFGQPAVARLSFGLGREGVAFTVPGVPETVRSIFQIWRHTQLVTGEPPPPPRGWGWGEEKGLSLGKEAGRQLQCREGCVRVCQARPPPPGSVCAPPHAGQPGRRAEEPEQRPSPGPRLPGAPGSPPGQGAPPGATLPTPAPRTLRGPPFSIEFSNTGARQWSCSGMHTQLTAGGG